MFNLASAEWLRMRKYWLPWALLVLLLAVLALQVNGKLDELPQLEANVETALAASDSGSPLTPFERFALESDHLEATRLRHDLHYPVFVGYAARLSTGFGWFAVILLTAVMAGEDFARRTLRAFLVRGVGRTRFLLTRCLVLWLVTGVGVVIVIVLAAAGGPYVHGQITDDPISLAGLSDALLFALRAWLTCLPFVAATLFWVVLAQHAGPALGVGIGLHFIELLVGTMLPGMVAIFALTGTDVPWFVRWQGKLLGVMLGYNANVVLHWGPPGGETRDMVQALTDSGGPVIVPTDPWRGVIFLIGYTLLSLGLAAWIFYRRDVTYGS
ncbi:MAG: ABC transporter permease subunit [Chloroflexota bacterium]|nr:ABC transporter permease subunit [Chloroflexota bacterium]